MNTEEIPDSKMQKRVILMEDGQRHLIYYTFQCEETESLNEEKKEDVGT